MGNFLPNYKKSIIDDITNNIEDYYVYASYSNTIPFYSKNDNFISNWNMIFGKKLSNADILPVISNNPWTSNTVYNSYNNIENISNFYVVSQVGNYHHIYKCMDNANNSVSLYDPSSIPIPTQPETFQTADNYKWKYITTISNVNYNKFATNDYIPIYPNTSIQSSSKNNSGIDSIVIANSGIGYNTYHSGIVQSVNSTCIQLESNASSTNSYYINNNIYLYNNNTPSSSQLLSITDYISNTSGRWVYSNSTVNTAIIQPGISNYIVSPGINIKTDGDTQTLAYAVMNTASNGISNVVIINTGSNISWANISISTNTSYPSNSANYANLYAIVPPVNGHGSDPASELNVKGMGINFQFSNSESNTIPTNISYSRIGLMKNPKDLDNIPYTYNTFNSLLSANLNPTLLANNLFTIGDTVTGNTSGSLGIVTFCNTSTIYLTGDKNFENGEYITSSNGFITTSIDINTLGNLNTKEINQLYVQDITTVNRQVAQSEEFKLIINI